MLGKIKTIEEIRDFRICPVARATEDVSIGTCEVFNMLRGYTSSDGYKIETDKHTFHVLIGNAQTCCEEWGYFSSDDNHKYFLGAELLEVNLTDKALNQTKVDESGYCAGYGGIQFVDFVTGRGVFQLAVHNYHNGYYGHPILVAKDEDILLNEVL